MEELAKGKNKVAWIWCATATWLLLGSTVVRSSEFENKSHIFLKVYPKVDFTLIGANEETYSTFLRSLRKRLVTGEDMRHEVPVLPERIDADASNRFVLVQLTNYEGHTVVLAIDAIDVYLRGYRVGNNAYFFQPEQDNPNLSDAITHLFTDTSQRQSLPFTPNYGDLEGRSENRWNISLGLPQLTEAIGALYAYPTGTVSQSELARAFIVLAQMVSEAARFRLIESRIRTRIHYGPAPPDVGMVALENDWSSYSRYVQRANPDGTLAQQENGQNSAGVFFPIDNVRQIVPILAIMLYICAPPPRQQQYFRHQFSPNGLCVDDVNPIQFSSLAVADSNNFIGGGDICVDPEPKVRISGPNGFCVDVWGGQYNDGNSIILWQCKSNDDVNQLWTLKKDGTIRSNGKCLTTYGYSPGVYVMIYDCEQAVRDATIWEIWQNGTIVNPISSLVLASKSGQSGATLTVETNVYTTSQSWLPGNSTKPSVTTIVGLNDLCLQITGNDVWLQECASNKAEQQWALYGDGSMRPNRNQNNCLTGSDENKSPVKIVPCSPVSSGQRWEFKSDGTIRNLFYDLVLDVKDNDPTNKQIILWPFHGQPNQLWFQVF